MALEADKRDRSYQFGRLLAILEKTERDTYTKDTDRETNAIRRMSVYAQRPYHIDVAYKVTALEHEEAALHGCRITDLYILPFRRERDIRVFAIAPVTEFAVEIACLCAFHGHRHLVGLAYLGGDIGHGEELHIPRVGVDLGTMDVKTVFCVKTELIAVFVFVRFPTDALVLAEVFAGNHSPSLSSRGVGLVSQEFLQPTDRLLGVPGEGVTVNVESGFGSCIHVFLDGFEVHVAIAIHTTGHLHGIACHRLGEVGVGHLIDRRFLEIVIDGGSGTEFEVGVLLVVNVLLECLVFIKVSIVVVVGLAQLVFLLCHGQG